MKKIIRFTVFILLPVSAGLFLLVLCFLNYDSVGEKFPFNLGIDEYALRAIFGITGFIITMLVVLSAPIKYSIKNHFKKKRKLKESKKDSQDDFADIEPQESWFGDSCCDCGQYSYQTNIHPHGKTLPRTRTPFWRVLWWGCYWIVGTFFEKLREKIRKNSLNFGFFIGATLFVVLSILSLSIKGFYGKEFGWFDCIYGSLGWSVLAGIFSGIIHYVIKGVKETRKQTKETDKTFSELMWKNTSLYFAFLGVLSFPLIFLFTAAHFLFNDIGFNLGWVLFITIIFTGTCLLSIFIIYGFFELISWIHEKRKNSRKKPPTVILLIGILAFTASINAQEPSETEYMREMILESFHCEKSFLDPTTGIKYFPELYGFEGYETMLGVATVIYPNGRGNFLWMGLFDKTENPPVLSIDGKFSFKFLGKIYRSLNEEEITHFPLWKGFSINISAREEDRFPGEFLIISGEVFNEEGKVCVFDVEYHIENLWLNKRDFNRGYPQPEEYIPSEVGGGNYNAIKLKNNYLYYTH